MKIWILGAKGQLGTAIVELCKKKNISYVASDREQADITQLPVLRELANQNYCTHIINCAAYTNVDLAEKEKEKAYAINVRGPENLGVIGKELKLKVLHISTDYVFDGRKQSPYQETDLPHPLNFYGKTKYEGEQRLLEKLPTSCVVRASWIFGNPNKNFISSIFSLLRKEEKIKVVSDQINRATYHKDLAEVLIDLSGQKGIFHFANERPLSRYEIMRDFYQEMKNRNIPMKCQEIIPVSMKDFPTPSIRPMYSVLATDKITKVLGKKPRSWETVLPEYIDHVAAQA